MRCRRCGGLIASFAEPDITRVPKMKLIYDAMPDSDGHAGGHMPRGICIGCRREVADRRRTHLGIVVPDFVRRALAA